MPHNQSFPTAANHFSFIPKADTKPGAITPIRVNVSTRASRSATKTKGSNIEAPESLRERPKSSYDRSQSMPRQNNVWPQCYNSFQKLQGQNATGLKEKESTPLKSCLKSESRSNSLARTSNTKGRSPSSRESPAKQNVNFKHDTKKLEEKEASTHEQPYELIDIKISQEKDQKVKMPPLQTKLYNNKNMRVIPIVRDARKEKTKSEHPFISENKYEPRTSAKNVPIQIQREKEKNLNPFLTDGDDLHESVNTTSNKSQILKTQTKDTPAPLATEDACYACDACTQTEGEDKKENCHLM
eukprot:GFUD01052103.1.p1 GENE.GFUD01052103.1~~GFUD01052103.1.p1  ORF type:complete len:346 (+),score=85.00 GFUD01052103.1:144-1040(+)